MSVFFLAPAHLSYLHPRTTLIPRSTCLFPRLSLLPLLICLLCVPIRTTHVSALPCAPPPLTRNSQPNYTPNSSNPNSPNYHFTAVRAPPARRAHTTRQQSSEPCPVLFPQDAPSDPSVFVPSFSASVSRTPPPPDLSPLPSNDMTQSPLPSHIPSTSTSTSTSVSVSASTSVSVPVSVSVPATHSQFVPFPSLTPLPPSAFPSPSSLQPSPATRQQRVVGGASLSVALLPYLAAIIFEEDGQQGICSATLVSPTLILSAAHCVVSKTQLQVYLGGSQGMFPDGEQVRVEAVQAHPLFDADDTDTAAYDIAWVRLADAAPAGARFMRVNVNESLPVRGAAVRNAGYGLTVPDDDASNPTFEANQVDVPVADADVCATRWAQHDGVALDAERQVCAGYLDGGCGSCNGDSGGPLLQYAPDGIPVLVGVASIAVRCSVTTVPTVYVAVAAHTAFLPPPTVTSRDAVQIILPLSNRTAPYGHAGVQATDLDNNPTQGEDDTQEQQSEQIDGRWATSVIVIVTVLGAAAVVLLAVAIVCACAVSRRHRARDNLTDAAPT